MRYVQGIATGITVDEVVQDAEPGDADGPDNVLVLYVDHDGHEYVAHTTIGTAGTYEITSHSCDADSCTDLRTWPAEVLQAIDDYVMLAINIHDYVVGLHPAPC